MNVLPSSGLRSAEKALLLSILDERKLTRGRSGWETSRRIFADVSGSKVIGLGLAIVLKPDKPGGKDVLVLTSAGEQRARHERARALGRYADQWTAKLEAAGV